MTFARARRQKNTELCGKHATARGRLTKLMAPHQGFTMIPTQRALEALSKITGISMAWPDSPCFPHFAGCLESPKVCQTFVLQPGACHENYGKHENKKTSQTATNKEIECWISRIISGIHGKYRNDETTGSWVQSTGSPNGEWPRYCRKV